VVCGAEFLRLGGQGTTCSVACLGRWRLENKGRDTVRSQATPDALSLGAKRIIARKARKVRAVLTPDGRFPSVTSAARHHKISEDTVRLRISAEWLGWRYAGPYPLPVPHEHEEQEQP
jgi:hypothetical protein